MARLMHSTARSMSFIRKGEQVRSRPRSRKAAASSAVEMPRAASTCDTSWG